MSPMAHLTCVGFVARRGEPAHPRVPGCGHPPLPGRAGRPARRRGAPETTASATCAASAELVQLIHRVQAERVPYGELPVPGLPARTVLRAPRARADRGRGVPERAPRSRSASQDIDALLAKQAAGANLGITQLFFHPEDYLALRAEGEGGGRGVPHPAGHHAGHEPRAAAADARAERRGPAQRARDPAGGRADRGGAARDRHRLGRAASRSSCSTAAPRASTCTRSTSTRPCSPCSSASDSLQQRHHRPTSTT